MSPRPKNRAKIKPTAEQELYNCMKCGEGDLRPIGSKNNRCQRCFNSNSVKRNREALQSMRQQEITGPLAVIVNSAHSDLILKTQLERKAEKKLRSCLSCQVKFLSEAFSLRTCGSCRARNARYSVRAPSQL